MKNSPVKSPSSSGLFAQRPAAPKGGQSNKKLLGSLKSFLGEDSATD